MLRHVVLINFHPEADDAQIEAMQERFEEIARALPQVAELECGRNLGFIEGSSDFAIVLGFASESDFQSYVSDPAHDDIASLLGGVASGRTVVDFIS
jgi:Stress responsive A/B Barrel Domain